jgi:AcrR family transcriptional regulator
MDHPDVEPRLPPIVAKAWGLDEPRGKGPRPGLTLDRVVDAAITVARTEGLAAVSMSRVAGALEVSTMGLYRYVTGKSELLTLMLDRAYGLPPAIDPGVGWREGMRSWARAMRDSMTREVWALAVPISSAPFTPYQVAWMDSCFAVLAGSTLAPAERASVLLLVSGYVRNQVALVAGLAAAAAADPVVAEVMRDWEGVLRRVADAARFPALAAALADGAFDDPAGQSDDDGLDAEFEFGLECILDGVEARIRART